MRITNGLILFDPGPEATALDSVEILPEDPEVRRGFHFALVHDAACRIRDLSAASHAAYIADHELAATLRSECPALEIETQTESSTGWRMQSAVEEQFDRGVRHLMVLFPLAVTVSLRTIETAFSLLDNFDDALILGPTTDGDVYAAGMRWPHPGLCAAYEGPSTGRFERMLHSVSPDECALYLLPARYGAVSREDLIKLSMDINSSQHSYMRIRAWLSEHMAGKHTGFQADVL